MKKKIPVKAKKKGVLAAVEKRKTPKPNPFETKKTAVRFPTLGRKVKGATKNIVKAKQDAVTKRKKTLLVEYRSLRKANSYVDNRFGEQDENLTEEEKALARFREQRLQQAKRKAKAVSGSKSKFSLSEAHAEEEEFGEEDGLTHGGKALGDIDEEDLNEKLGLDDLDEDLAAELVRQYNFGGGPDAPKGADGKPKTKKEIMHEIIAKSKMYKAQKAKQKEEDEDEQEKLDKEFRDLVQSQALAKLVKPTGYMKGVKVKADGVVDSKYDEAARMLATELKGAAGERTLMPDEVANRERIRLERLEKERLKRMRGDGGDDDPDVVPSDGLAEGGFASRRRKQKEREDAYEAKEKKKADKKKKRKGGDDDGGDDGDEDDEDEDDEDESDEGDEGEDGDDMDLEELTSALDRRRKERAAGGDELNESFRSQAAELLKKYGVKADNPLVKKRKQMEGDDDDDDGEDGEDEDEDEDEDEEGEDGEGEEGVSDLGEEGEDEEIDGEDEDDEDEGEAKPAGTKVATEKLAAVQAAELREAAAAKIAARSAAAAELPFTIQLPSSYPAFAALVEGRPAEDLVLAVARIRSFNAAKMAADSKRGLQEFYGMLVQHFAMLAGQLPVPMSHLDAMVPLILGMTQEVPFYAATVARARLKNINSRLSAALSIQYGTSDPAAAADAAVASTSKGTSAAPSSSASSSSHPMSRALLQLKLFTTLFPASDRRHPVLTPAGLLLGRALSQCVAVDTAGVARGLFLASLALHLAAPAKRVCPEVINFLTDLFSSYLPASASSQQQHTNNGSSENGSVHGSGSNGSSSSSGSAVEGEGLRRVVAGLLSPTTRGGALAQVQVAEVDMLTSISDPEASSHLSDDAHKLALLGIGMHAASRALSLSDELAAAPELFQPLRSVLKRLGAALKLPLVLEEQRRTLLTSVESVSARQTSMRRPLVSAAMVTRESRGLLAASRKEYNPRFEEDFAPNRDYDPDRVKVEARKLKKQVRQEKRGAMRELRKDAAFMSDTRDRERAVVDGERMENQKKFYAELQAQASDIKSGGQAGMNPHLKKKK